MALHGLGKVTLGVPNVDETISYYVEFGLEHRGGGVFATRNGGEQLEIVNAPTRRLVELTVAADDPDDIAAITGRLSGLGVAFGVAIEHRVGAWTIASCSPPLRVANTPPSRCSRPNST